MRIWSAAISAGAALNSISYFCARPGDAIALPCEIYISAPPLPRQAAVFMACADTGRRRRPYATTSSLRVTSARSGVLRSMKFGAENRESDAGQHHRDSGPQNRRLVLGEKS